MKRFQEITKKSVLLWGEYGHCDHNYLYGILNCTTLLICPTFLEHIPWVLNWY